MRGGPRWPATGLVKGFRRVAKKCSAKLNDFYFHGFLGLARKFTGELQKIDFMVWWPGGAQGLFEILLKVCFEGRASFARMAC